MLTRSKAKQLEQRTRDATTQAVIHHNGVPRTSTEMLIGPSATGQGTHIRWIRPDVGQTSTSTAEKVRDAQVEDEEEYTGITPAPTLLQMPGAPQKTLRRGHERIHVYPLLWTLGNTQEEHEPTDTDARYLGSGVNPGSPFQFSSKETLTPTHSFVYLAAGDPQVLVKKSPQALGPHGTELIDEHGNPMYFD